MRVHEMCRAGASRDAGRPESPETIPFSKTALFGGRRLSLAASLARHPSDQAYQGAFQDKAAAGRKPPGTRTSLSPGKTARSGTRPWHHGLTRNTFPPLGFTLQEQVAP
jgi:hypothetical protein